VDPFRDPFSKETLSPRHHAKDEEQRLPPKGQAAEKSNNTTHISTSQSSLPNEDKEQRLLSKRQAVVWRNESKERGQATEKLDNIIQVSTSQSS
jgi:hypothetical protein